MPCSAHDVTSYVFTDRDRLFVDANVWLFVHGPSKPGDRRVAAYSRALAKCVAARSAVQIDALVLSEFVNRYARIRHSVLQLTGAAAPRDFKQFRNGPRFRPVAEEIADAVRRILAVCNRMESGFSSVDILAMISRYALGGHDFNDQMIIDLCRRQGLVLVTDDRDFGGSGLTLVTANRKLLP